jgi:hypothetical protein
MEVSKTVQAGVVNLTTQKRKELETEYDNFQKYIQGEEDVELYSAIKQDAFRYLCCSVRLLPSGRRYTELFKILTV